MQTLKIEYAIEEDAQLIVEEFRRQYAICLRSAYNRMQEGKSDREIYKYLKTLKNIDDLGSSTFSSVIARCHYIVKADSAYEEIRLEKQKALEKKISELKNKKKLTYKDKKLIERFKKSKHSKHAHVFGGKKLLTSYLNGKITKEEYHQRRLGVFEILGDKFNYGNPLFRISSFKSFVIFQPSRDSHIFFHLTHLSKNQRRTISELYERQQRRDLPITYKFDEKYLYISFDERELYGIQRHDKIHNRVLAIDQNPNYIGWSVVDWNEDSTYRIISSGVFNVKQINDIEVSQHIRKTNKRKYELFQIANKLVAIGINFKCSILGIEKLDFSKSESSNRKLNRLVYNMWCRNYFIRCLKHKCCVSDLEVIESFSQYSSKFGNVLYRKHGLPDMVNASIEIGRRAVEFKRQYIEHSADISHTIIHPDLTHFGDALAKSMEEFGITEECKDLYELFGALAKRKKNSESLYRVPLESTRPKWFKSSSKKSLVLHCEYDTNRQSDEFTKAFTKHGST